jgi:hypothetical protein
MRPPQRLNGVIGDLREGDGIKIRGGVALFVLGLLFFVQSAFIAFQLPSQEVASLAGSLFGCLGCWLWALYLSSANDRRRWLKVPLITLVVLYFGVTLTLTAVRFFHDRQVEGQARQWFTQAQEDAKPAWTEDDAARWFNEHGILPYRGEASGSGGHHYVVDGYQQIKEGGTFAKPASVQISFLFDVNRKFQRVEYHVQPFVPPDRWQR